MAISHEQAQAPFHIELLEVLKEVNSKRPANEAFSFRKAVVDGLNLKDSFTTKIKAGIYVPTIDRLVSLANLLGVPPTRFNAYVTRFGVQQVHEDSDVIALFRLIASQPKDIQVLLKKGLVQNVTAWLQKAST